MVTLNKREKIIAVVTGVIVFLWIGINFSSNKRSMSSKRKTMTQKHRRTKGKRGVKQEEQVDVDHMAQLINLSATSSEQEMVKDPFKPIEAQEPVGEMQKESSDLVLYGIMWEEEEPVVLINEQILKIGDMILGYTVKEILKNEVTLMKDHKKTVLKVFEDIDQE